MLQEPQHEAILYIEALLESAFLIQPEAIIGLHPIHIQHQELYWAGVVLRRCKLHSRSSHCIFIRLSYGNRASLGSCRSAGIGIFRVIDLMQQGSRFVSIDAIDHSMSWREHRD